MEELGLIKVGNVQITPSGSLYVEKLSDTLHRVKKYRLSLIDGSTRELTFKEYSVISEGIPSSCSLKSIPRTPVISISVS